MVRKHFALSAEHGELKQANLVSRLGDVLRDLPLRGQLVQPAHLQHRSCAGAIEARVR